MNRFKRLTERSSAWLPQWILLGAAALVAACGNGGLDPILGTPGAGARPMVTATEPVASAPDVTGVAPNVHVTATFSESMSAATLTPSTFTLACPAGAPVSAQVTYDDATHTATLTPSRALPASTACTATVSTAAQDSTGFALEHDFVWRFVTAPPPDVTPPTVVITSPLADARNVAINTQIAAEFSEGMNPASLTGASFTLVNDVLGTRVPGTVTYSVASRTAFFTPASPATLANDTPFTATITTAVTDLAGNALGKTHVWRFTTTAQLDTTRPTVVLTVPAHDATAVASNTVVTATFSEAMNPDTLSGTSFTLFNNTLGTAVAGTVSYAATGRTALFTPTSPATLAAGSLFTATVTTAVTDLAGNALAATAVWTFTTAGIAPADTTRPTVVNTVPVADASAVPINTAVTATFSEPMNPATLSGATFTLVNTTSGTPVTGTVTYSATARTLTFTSTAPSTLANNSAFAARIETGVTDLAGNGLADPFVWRFTTESISDNAAPSVVTVSPLDNSTATCTKQSVSATFSEAMDAESINTGTFVVSDQGVLVAGTVTYDTVSRVATFTPTATTGFEGGRTFVVTLDSGSLGMTDVSGNPLVADRVWTFTTGTQDCVGTVNPRTVNLRTAASFGALGGSAGVTNQGINTVVAGNLGSTAVCTAITGFHDGPVVYTETTLNVGAVNGSIYCAPPAPGTATTQAIAAQALADAQAAYNALALLPPGSDPGAGQLGDRVLVPGVYTAAGGTFGITTGDLTLDARGDANAVWVFQSAGALTVGQPALPRRVLLINGAQAGNVYWQVGSAARIEDGSVMVGTIIAPAGVTISTAGQTLLTRLIGRAIGLIASVTMVNTTVVAP